jgi:hypothetical protein
LGWERFGCRAFEEEDDAVRSDVQLLDPHPRNRQSSAVVVGEREYERTPNAVSEGEPKFAALHIEVIGRRVGPKERTADVREVERGRSRTRRRWLFAKARATSEATTAC